MNYEFGIHRTAMREPLVHFVIAGFALFVVYGLLHPERFAADSSRRVELSATDVARVKLAFVTHRIGERVLPCVGTLSRT